MAQHKSSTSQEKYPDMLTLKGLFPSNSGGFSDEHNQDDFWSRKANGMDQFEKKSLILKEEGRKHA